MSQLDWPAGWERTAEEKRRPKDAFTTGLRETIDELEHVLEVGMDVDDWRLDTAAEHQKKNPKYPYADASPDDPGAVVRWTLDGEQFAVACDRFSRLRDNVREILKYVDDKRRLGRRPVQTGADEFANAQLPAGEGEPIGADPFEILGVDPDASEDEILEAYRERLKEVHGDQGGDWEYSPAELRDARDRAHNRGDRSAN